MTPYSSQFYRRWAKLLLYLPLTLNANPLNVSSDSAHYAHTDLSCITTELCEIPVLSPVDGAVILHMIK